MGETIVFRIEDGSGSTVTIHTEGNGEFVRSIMFYARHDDLTLVSVA